jgi:alcohol dehydrogenase class IV/gamma-glutamyl-gamma-aminobutyrate hydrolase PuuD
MKIEHFSFPTAIHFGGGARKLVGVHLRDHGFRRPLIVTDRALATLPVMKEFMSHLQTGLDVGIFEGVFGNPTAAQVNAGAAAFKAHRADCVIGFGGGAALDVAKVVGVVAANEGDAIEYAWDHPKARKIEEVPYFVAVPTTSGTGSEVGRSSVVSENDSGVKRVIFSPRILARHVFADPEVTFALPAAVTAATGMDALTHNVESYLSPAYHPLCDGIALEGTRIAARALVTAVKEPGNYKARADMMMASMMGAIAFQKDLGAVHSCAHALGAVCDLPSLRTWRTWWAPAAPPASCRGSRRSSRRSASRRGWARWACGASSLAGWWSWPKRIFATRPTRGLCSGRTLNGSSRRRTELGTAGMPAAMQPGTRAGADRLKIGISACFFHADPQRPIFTGKTLQYAEQSIVHWVQRQGAIAFIVPSPAGSTQRGDVTLAHYAELLDGLVLEGGSDLWPGSYGEEPLRPEWSGDRVRDEYEIALTREFVAAGKPVLGVCRGLQLLNVAFGGTLYQDIATQQPGALRHRDAALYDRNFHAVEFVPGTRLAALHPGVPLAIVNSVHHQGIKDLAPFMTVEARCPNDGTIEAIRYDNERGPVQSYVAAVQWHPEFHDGAGFDLARFKPALLPGWQPPVDPARLPRLIDDDPMLADFLGACERAKGAR